MLFRSFVTITEGELDALAAYQMMGSKYPVVSIKNGAQSAVRDCQAQYEWLDSFETIVLAFDADEVGSEAAAKVAELFGSKVRIMKMQQGFKDACDYLKESKSADFVKQWWAAEKYVPDGIIDGADLLDLVMQPLPKAQAHYPYLGLNQMTGGIRQQEMVVVTAGASRHLMAAWVNTLGEAWSSYSSNGSSWNSPVKIASDVVSSVWVSGNASGFLASWQDRKSTRLNSSH